VAVFTLVAHAVNVRIHHEPAVVHSALPGLMTSRQVSTITSLSGIVGACCLLGSVSWCPAHGPGHLRTSAAGTRGSACATGDLPHRRVTTVPSKATSPRDAIAASLADSDLAGVTAGTGHPLANRPENAGLVTAQRRAGDRGRGTGVPQDDRDGDTNAGQATRGGDVAENITVSVVNRAVLVVDDVFLLRPGLRELWTLLVCLRVSAEETLRRAHRRDLELFGSAGEVQRRFLRRYLPGQVLYRQRSDPSRRPHPRGQRTDPGTSNRALGHPQIVSRHLINAPVDGVSSCRRRRRARSP
jgi:hypothetical protein